MAKLVWLAILGALQVVDVVTTDHLRDLEANPVVRFLFLHLGDAWWVPKLLAIVFIGVLAMYAPRLPKVVFIVAGVYGLAVLINLANITANYLVG